MDSVDYPQVNGNITDAGNDDKITLPCMDGNSNANKFNNQRMKSPSEPPALSHTDCVLPELPKTITSGQYFEFEQIANGIDGYFDGNSDTDDENFGGSEDSSLTFDMCGKRLVRHSSKSPPEIRPCRRLGNGRNTHHRIDVEDIRKEVEEEGLDPEDVLCTVREDYARAPPLAQEDDFDDDV